MDALKILYFHNSKKLSVFNLLNVIFHVNQCFHIRFSLHFQSKAVLKSF